MFGTMHPPLKFRCQDPSERISFKEVVDALEMFKVEGESIVEQLSEFRKQRAAWQQEIDASLDGYLAMQEEQTKLADKVAMLELREIRVAERERALLHQIEALKFQHRESMGLASTGGGGGFLPMSGFGAALVDNVVSSNGTIRRKGSGVGERGRGNSFGGGGGMGGSGAGSPLLGRPGSRRSSTVEMIGGRSLDPSRWSEADVAAWIATLPNGCSVYEDAIKSNNINGMRLLKLTESVLKEAIGIKSYGHRMDILEAVQGLTRSNEFPSLGIAAGNSPKKASSVGAPLSPLGSSGGGGGGGGMMGGGMLMMGAKAGRRSSGGGGGGPSILDSVAMHGGRHGGSGYKPVPNPRDVTVRLNVTATGTANAWLLEVVCSIVDADSPAAHIERLLEHVQFVYTRPNMLGQTDSAFCEAAPYSCQVPKGDGKAAVTVTCKIQYMRCFKRKSTQVKFDLKPTQAAAAAAAAAAADGDGGEAVTMASKDVSLVLKQGDVANSRR